MLWEWRKKKWIKFAYITNPGNIVKFLFFYSVYLCVFLRILLLFLFLYFVLFHVLVTVPFIFVLFSVFFCYDFIAFYLVAIFQHKKEKNQATQIRRHMKRINGRSFDCLTYFVHKVMLHQNGSEHAKQHKTSQASPPNREEHRNSCERRIKLMGYVRTDNSTRIT